MRRHQGQLLEREEPSAYRDIDLTMVGGLLLTLPILFLTPAFFPEPLLPEWVRAVASVNAAYVIETGQRLMSLGNDWARTSGRSSRSARPPLSSSRWPCWHREAPRNDAAGRRWRPSTADHLAATSGRSRSRLISRSWPDGSALWSPTRIPAMGARLSISAGRNRRRIA